MARGGQRMISQSNIRNIFTVLILAVFVQSCMGKTSPTLTNVNETTGQIFLNQAPAMLWGVWTVAIDTSNETIIAVPIRGAEFAANVTMFLQPPSGKLSNLKFNNMDFTKWADEGKVDLDVGLTHPFPGLNQYTGFDVMGVFMHNGSNNSGYPMAYNATWGRIGKDGVLLNADGYTRWFNATEFNKPGILGYTPGAAGTKDFIPKATLNGFKYFADGLDKNQSLTDFYSISNNCANRGCFLPGSTNYRHYSIQFPMDSGSLVLKFQYAVIANWKPFEGGPPYPVSDFPLSANMAEPLILNIDTSESTLYYNSPGDYGGDLKIKLEILDHQQALTGSEIAKGIATVAVESPDNLLGGCPTFPQTYLENNSEPAGPSSSVYTIEIPGTACVHNGQGEKSIMITVISEDPTSYDSGIPGWPFPENPRLSSYAIGWVTIGPGSSGNPPVGGDLSYYWDCSGDPCSGQIITFEISEAYDPDGNPVTIGWDFDGDLDFDDDTDGDNTNLSGQYSWGTPGSYDVWCRIDDGTEHTDIGPLNVNVVDCIPDSMAILGSAKCNTQTGWGNGVAINANDGYAYTTIYTGSTGALCVYDADPPESVAEVGSVALGPHNFLCRYYEDTANDKDYVYCGGVSTIGLSTVDVTTPTAPTVVDVFSPAGSPNPGWMADMVIADDYLFIAYQYGGILIMDLADPAHPNMVGHTPWGYPTVNECRGIAVTPDGEWGYYTDGVIPTGPQYINVTDMNDKTNPTVTLKISVPSMFNPDLDLANGKLYLHCDSAAQLLIYDLTDPGNPSLISTTDLNLVTNQIIHELIVRGSYAYFSGCIGLDGYVWSYDISDPMAVTKIGTSPTLIGDAYAIEEHCGLAYCAIATTPDPADISILSLY